MACDIILSTINAKWTHPSLALRLLKANLGPLEERCEIMEWTLRQPLEEKVNAILAAAPSILGLSVSIWNHAAALELLKALEKKCPVIVLGGPEVSWLPPAAEIFRYANFIVRGDGEHAFRKICEQVLRDCEPWHDSGTVQRVDIRTIKTGYPLYTEDDARRKLIYVESSRGCPFNCEFCLSSIKTGPYVLESAAPENDASAETTAQNPVRFFPLDQFLAEMDALIKRGAQTIKFLDRTFNLDIKRAVKILEFFLEKINERKKDSGRPLLVHFEMVPSNFPPELREILRKFPPDTLRLEIGIQTLNAEVSARIGRPSNPESELEILRFLRENTSAIIHADLIAGLPGEDFSSFSGGFDRLWAALSQRTDSARYADRQPRTEIQLGILKLLPGAPIARHTEAFGMRYNSLPPYEVMETSTLSAAELERIKNFARFWELIVNRGLINLLADDKFKTSSVFTAFMALSDSLFAHFGRNWGIDKNELRYALQQFRADIG